ncbi:hypothetical protein QBC41DRAFT_319779 [Cercophora samala]|uniref:2EXR domain-containing protein n=1 Tax=Cercophora samala TaxID=330535 RepID=A0AA40DAR5_9PEZI|nr:hypothetical protein QBC41DRAFT_319779 [Cercophora samala]
MATTFHPFPLLPYELRAQIWELASASPRTVQVRVRHRKKYPNLPATYPVDRPYSDYCYKKQSATVPQLITGLTPVPAVMQTCHESRAIGSKFYSRACAELVPELISARRERGELEESKRQRNQAKRLIRQEKEERERRAAGGLLTAEEEEHGRLVDLYGELVEYVPEERYIYINWERDVVSIGRCNERWMMGGEAGMELEDIEPVAHLVRKLMYEREYSDEMYVRFEIQELKMFTRLEELHIVTRDEFPHWQWASSEFWPCDEENVWVYEDADVYDDYGKLYETRGWNLVQLDQMLEYHGSEGDEAEEEGESL